MTREEFRNHLLDKCGECAETSLWCSVVRDDYPENRRVWNCNIEEEWKWFLVLGMPPREFLERVYGIVE